MVLTIDGGIGSLTTNDYIKIKPESLGFECATAYANNTAFSTLGELVLVRW